MCVQEYLKALRNGDTKDDTLKQEVENAVLNLKMRKEAIDLEKIPPNSFCLHAVVLTKDGYILRTRRDKKLAYYAEQYDFSIEKQLNVSDIGMENSDPLCVTGQEKIMNFNMTFVPGRI